MQILDGIEGDIRGSIGIQLVVDLQAYHHLMLNLWSKVSAANTVREQSIEFITKET